MRDDLGNIVLGLIGTFGVLKMLFYQFLILPIILGLNLIENIMKNNYISNYKASNDFLIKNLI